MLPHFLNCLILEKSQSSNKNHEKENQHQRTIQEN